MYIVLTVLVRVIQSVSLHDQDLGSLHDLDLAASEQEHLLGCQVLKTPNSNSRKP